MNTHANPFQRIELTSLHLQAAPDLTAALAFTVSPTFPDSGAIEALGRTVQTLDRHLTHDPVDGLEAFLAEADGAHDLADRVATLHLLTRAGAEGLDATADLDRFETPPAKRITTPVEQILVRQVAIEGTARDVLVVAALEAGGAQTELASLPPEALTIEDGRAFLDLPGGGHQVARRGELPAWAVPHLDRLELGGPWLMHTSDASTPKGRECTFTMAAGNLLRRTGLAWVGTVKPISITRTALRQMACDGIDGWDRAVAACGRRSAKGPDRLLRLAEPW